MYSRRIALTASRLALILFFVLALAGCGDDADDMDPGMDEMVLEEHEDEEEHEHEHEDEHAEEVVTFDDHDGFERGESEGFTQYLRVTSDGRYGFVLQRSRNVTLDDHGIEDNRVYIVDSGLSVEEHGDHFDPVTRAPSLLPYQLGHGGEHAGEANFYNPVHFVTHHGLTAIFYDGIAGPSDDNPDLVEQNGWAVVYRNSDFEGSTEPPMPIFELEVDHYSHGAVVPVDDEHFIVTIAEPEGLPNGVEVYEAHEHGDHVDIEHVADFSGLCPRLHGEATWGPYVAFSCLDGDGILVLTHDHETGEFASTVVSYPGMYKSGGVVATTLHADEVGHDDVIFMVRYGPNQQDFAKITEHDIEEGLGATPDVLEMPWGSDARHRAFAFEPVDGSAVRLLVQDADPDNYHLDVLELGDMDHDVEGQGHFVVLTATGDLHIYDLTMESGEELVGTISGIVGAECPEGIGCPSLALAPGFAYVSDPAEGKVYEVHLAEAHIERELDEHFDAPTQLVVLGRFGYELEHSHGRHE